MGRLHSTRGLDVRPRFRIRCGEIALSRPPYGVQHTLRQNSRFDRQARRAPQQQRKGSDESPVGIARCLESSPPGGHSHNHAMATYDGQADTCGEPSSSTKLRPMRAGIGNECDCCGMDSPETGCAPGCAPGDWNNDNDSDEKNSLVHQVFVAGPNKH